MIVIVVGVAAPREGCSLQMHRVEHDKRGAEITNDESRAAFLDRKQRLQSAVSTHALSLWRSRPAAPPAMTAIGPRSGPQAQ